MNEILRLLNQGSEAVAFPVPRSTVSDPTWPVTVGTVCGDMSSLRRRPPSVLPKSAASGCTGEVVGKAHANRPGDLEWLGRGREETLVLGEGLGLERPLPLGRSLCLQEAQLPCL